MTKETFTCVSPHSPGNKSNYVMNKIFSSSACSLSKLFHSHFLRSLYCHPFIETLSRLAIYPYQHSDKVTNNRSIYQNKRLVPILILPPLQLSTCFLYKHSLRKKRQFANQPTRLLPPFPTLDTAVPPTSLKPSEIFPFLDLPRELRDIIYSSLLEVNYAEPPAAKPLSWNAHRQ